MLTRTDILINRIRQQSDTADENSLSNLVMLDYLNDAQRTIQNILFQSDRANSLFIKRQVINVIPEVIEYPLNDDLFAEGSVLDIHSIEGNRVLRRYQKEGFGERSQAFAYVVENDGLVLNHSPQNDLLVRYVATLPSMSTRLAKVDSISGQVLTVSDLVEKVDYSYEYLSLVDKKGVIIADNLLIDDITGNLVTLDGDLSNAVAGLYLVGGRCASTHGRLPEICETYLKLFVQRKVLAHISSKKIASSSIFSKQEREDLIELFEDRSGDIEYPMITDSDFLDY